MDALAAREVRRLRWSLAWAGVVVLGIALFVVAFFGSPCPGFSPSLPISNATTQSSVCVPRLLALVVSLPLVLGGMVALAWQWRSTRRKGRSNQPAG